MSVNNNFCPLCHTYTMITYNDGGTKYCRVCKETWHFCPKDVSGKRIGVIYKCKCNKENTNISCAIL